MVSLDSTLIEFPISILNECKKDRFVHHAEQIPGRDEYINKWLHKKPFIGIKSILIKENTETVQLDFSAKVLGNDYRNGINLNTFGQVVDRVNDTGLINVDPGDLLEEGTIHRTDATATIEIEHDINRVINSLGFMSSNPNYECELYNSKTNKGISFKRKVKSYRERQLLYHKRTELNTRKNKVFREAYPKAYNSFGPYSLRVESNISSHKLIRGAFKVMSPNLGLVLQSEEPINYNLFRKILKEDVQLGLFADYVGMTPTEVRNDIGYRGIYQRCNGDLQTCFSWIKSSVRGNPSRYKREYTDAFRGIELERRGNKTVSIIHEIQEALKNAS